MEAIKGSAISGVGRLERSQNHDATKAQVALAMETNSNTR